MSKPAAKIVHLQPNAREALPKSQVQGPTEGIIVQAQDGDENAYREIYERYSRVVYTLAYQMVGSHSDADEIVQETFIRVFKGIQRLRKPGAFVSWLYQITINLSIDHRKLRTRRRMLPLDEQTEAFSGFELATSKRVKDPSQVLENKELLDQINECIDALPAQQKAVVILHEIEGLSKKMISEVLQCSVVTVRTNLHHARKKLRKELIKYVKA